VFKREGKHFARIVLGNGEDRDKSSAKADSFGIIFARKTTLLKHDFSKEYAIKAKNIPCICT